MELTGKGEKETIRWFLEFYPEFLDIIPDKCECHYSSPGSRTEALAKGIIKTGKQIFTFEDEANQSLLAMGAKPIKIEELKKQH